MNNLFNDLEEVTEEFLRLWDGTWLIINPIQSELLIEVTNLNSVRSLIKIDKEEYEFDTKDPQSSIDLLQEKLFIELKRLNKKL